MGYLKGGKNVIFVFVEGEIVAVTLNRKQWYEFQLKLLLLN